MTKPIPELTDKQLRNFWRKVDVRGPDDCWNWTGAVNRRGYGTLWLGGVYKAHRVSMAIDGCDPLELMACHSCDNPPCINPAHLFAGTGMDNINDREAKARGARGESHGLRKLTEDDVRAIRADTRVHRIIAEEYGVSDMSISHVKSRKTWMHVA